ncbi:hypothetical protein AB0K62_08780 [Streptomyces halstedii]|uniref:hypothetical protein n=1 Tax=Streptomyces halstedii TaxID=1944 RepID=UPI0034604F37
MSSPSAHLTQQEIEVTVQHLTQSRIAAALAAVPQPEGERPWHLLLTKPPTTYHETRMRIALEDPGTRKFSDVDEPTALAEASRARIIHEMARRDGYMDALAVTEQMMNTTPALPSDTFINLAPWADGPEIRWAFHRDAAAVRVFAAHFGLPVTERPHTSAGTTTYVSATGTVSGVQIDAYALIDTPAPGQVTA